MRKVNIIMLNTRIRPIYREVINLKKFLARGTLLAPMQFPMMLHVASWNPSGNMKSIAVISSKIVIAARSCTPMIPDIIVNISNAHHSEQIIKVAGKLYFR